ncbi:MAG TPA: hypothetical protein VE987_09080 [Polyangiaceae bacterium]|nr:hypothetical protein [Polyangiaceae bacterium]
MDIRADAQIPFPREVVFAAYRDDIAQLVPYLPNVRGIHVKSRTEEGRVVKLVNEWRGGGEIPSAIRAVVGDSMLSWTDYASWDADAMRCDWRSETQAFAEALRCVGHNAFLDGGPGKTQLQVRGTLEVDARKIRGVPSFLASKVGRALEEFLGSRINVNLAETATALTKFLETRK